MSVFFMIHFSNTSLIQSLRLMFQFTYVQYCTSLTVLFNTFDIIYVELHVSVHSLQRLNAQAPEIAHHKLMNDLLQP